MIFFGNHVLLVFGVSAFFQYPMEKQVQLVGHVGAIQLCWIVSLIDHRESLKNECMNAFFSFSPVRIIS